jgi:hypothetical protein
MGEDFRLNERQRFCETSFYFIGGGVRMNVYYLRDDWLG